MGSLAKNIYCSRFGPVPIVYYRKVYSDTRQVSQADLGLPVCQNLCVPKPCWQSHIVYI